MTTVRRCNFRHSAQELGVSAPALNHSIRNLEARLGVKLPSRTSRSVVPTDANSAPAAKLEDGFQVIGEALGELDAYRTSPVGQLHLSVPRDASWPLLGPVLRRFTEAYPDLQPRLSVEDRIVGIVTDGYDTGIRYGGAVPQDMVAVPLTGELRWVVAVSSNYLACHGMLQQPGDLLRHTCIYMRLDNNSLYKRELDSGERIVGVGVFGPFSVNEDNTVAATALGGIGLAYCLEVGIAKELRNGWSQLVLSDWISTSAPFCLCYPNRHQPRPGLRQLMGMIRGDWLERA